VLRTIVQARIFNTVCNYDNGTEGEDGRGDLTWEPARGAGEFFPSPTSPNFLRKYLVLAIKHFPCSYPRRQVAIQKDSSLAVFVNPSLPYDPREGVSADQEEV
jgi:hypothetical protein